MKRKIQILKIVFLTLSSLLLFAFTVLYFIGRDLQKHKFSILLPDDRDSIVIPFQYHVDGVITTKIILEKDTLDFIIDTGANNSIISPEYLTEKTTHKTVFDWLGLRIRDASGIKRWKPKTTVKDVTWGDIVFNNHSFVVSDFTFPGLIGGDLLRNFCVKFDNEKNILILSKKRNEVNNNEIVIPFKFTGNCVLITGNFLSEVIPKNTNDASSLNTFDLMFDTGFTGELKSNKPSCQLLNIPSEKQKVWKGLNSSTLFAPEGIYSSDSTIIYFMSDFKLGNITFLNTIINGSMLPESYNLLGTVFMRRFRSYTIDYPNQTIYFQLADNSKINNSELKRQLPFYVEIPENNTIDLSQETIKDVPSAYLPFLYARFYSLGFDFTNINNNHIVTAVELNRYKQGVNIGDTLIGIDSILFRREFLNLVNNQNQKFVVEKNLDKQMNILSITQQFRKNDRNYHFLKKGELYTIHTKRDTISNFRPKSVYSFGEHIYPYYIFFKSNYFNMNNSSYNVHILSKPFVEKEIEVTEYRNGATTIRRE